MTKNILVFPGTYWVLALCKRIKALGHRILLVDPNSDCPCRVYADEYLQSDIFDWNKVFLFVQEKKADAVMSDECDIAMPMVSKLGESLGLSVQNSEITHLYTNKFLMREFCKRYGFKCPEYKLCNTKK